MPAIRATMSRSVLDKIDWYRTFRPLEIVFYSTCRIGTERSAVQTFRFHLARRRRMPAPAKSKAVATVKLNEIEDVKESQPASQGQSILSRTECDVVARATQTASRLETLEALGTLTERPVSR